MWRPELTGGPQRETAPFFDDFFLNALFVLTGTQFVTPCLSSSVANPVKFRFHQMFFPATQFLSIEEISVVPAVVRDTLNECRFINFLSHPPLSLLDWRSTICAFTCVASDHLFFTSCSIGRRHS